MMDEAHCTELRSPGTDSCATHQWHQLGQPLPWSSYASWSSTRNTEMCLQQQPPPKKCKKRVPGATRFIIINHHLIHFIIIFIISNISFQFFNQHQKGFLGNHHQIIHITLSIFIKIIISKIIQTFFSNNPPSQRFFKIFFSKILWIIAVPPITNTISIIA